MLLLIYIFAMSNPYLIQGPALISFSGGRTSAYMLHEILRAYGGTLPGNVKVAFANTGKEREETLRFVHECGSRWGVHVHWLEYRPGAPGFEEIGYNSAARTGEPFLGYLAKEKANYLPSPVQRSCTQFLKVRVLEGFSKSLGWSTWLNVIGLRHDEGHRVLKMLARNDSGKEKAVSVAPLSKAKVTRRHVMEFWAKQPFDLNLRPFESNCDLCFMKGSRLLAATIREHPGIERWWIDLEQMAGRQFVSDRSYAQLSRSVYAQGDLFGGFLADGEEEHDVECGLLCAAE